MPQDAENALGLQRLLNSRSRADSYQGAALAAPYSPLFLFGFSPSGQISLTPSQTLLLASVMMMLRLPAVLARLRHLLVLFFAFLEDRGNALTAFRG